MSAHSEKATDLQYCEEDAVASNDDIVDRSNLLISIVEHAGMNELARSIAFRDVRDVDDHEMHGLRYGTARIDATSYGNEDHQDSRTLEELPHILVLSAEVLGFRHATSAKLRAAGAMPP